MGADYAALIKIHCCFNFQVQYISFSNYFKVFCVQYFQAHRLPRYKSGGFLRAGRIRQQCAMPAQPTLLILLIAHTSGVRSEFYLQLR